VFHERRIGGPSIRAIRSGGVRVVGIGFLVRLLLAGKRLPRIDERGRTLLLR
jgi:hypothetical protein